MAHVFEVVTREFELVTREFELVTCGFELVTHGFELVTRRFELVTRESELVTRVLLFQYKLINCIFSPVSIILIRIFVLEDTVLPVKKGLRNYFILFYYV